MPLISLLDMAYKTVFKPILFRCDAEITHKVTLRLLSVIPPWLHPHDAPSMTIRLWGLSFQSPVGLAAGMDKNALAGGAWEALGFGFAEFGTVTLLPQKGNAKPRIFRYSESKAIVNRQGFPSDGADAVAARIRRQQERGLTIPLGVNIGPNQDTPDERIPAEFAELAARFSKLASFIVVNVSSPNTANLRSWQTPERLSEIYGAISDRLRSCERHPPVLFKIAPDLSDSAVDEISDISLRLGVGGVVVSNTTTSRSDVGPSVDEQGGLSGAPLKLRARSLISRIYSRTSGTLPIIGVGGIFTAEDAYEHIKAGASLVELFTGMTYEGPGLPTRIKRELALLLERDGFSSVSEAVGTGTEKAENSLAPVSCVA
jgi:dihydroorotate dehydrogenase